MKYMVMVNGKYMTQVETEHGAGGAERILMDDVHYGIKSALAFDAETIKTQHFVECLQACKLVSLGELRQMSAAAKAKIDSRVAAAQSELVRVQAQLEQLKQQELAARYALNSAKCEQDDDAI